MLETTRKPSSPGREGVLVGAAIKIGWTEEVSQRKDSKGVKEAASIYGGQASQGEGTASAKYKGSEVRPYLACYRNSKPTGVAACTKVELESRSNGESADHLGPCWTL